MAVILEIEKKDLDNKKPEDYSSGSLNGSDNRSNIVDVGNPTIFDPLIIHNGKNMAEGFIKIPRSLLNSETWEKLIPKHKVVFLTIMKIVCYRPFSFDDFGVIINLLPGQVCTTYKELADKCGKGINKNDSERGIKKLKLLRFVSTEVRHKKTIISITHPDICSQINSLSETTSETNLRQERDKLEMQKKKEKKEKKEKNIKPTGSPIATSLLEYFIFSLKKYVPEVVKIPKAKTVFEFDKLLSHYTEEEIKKTIDYAHKTKFWAPLIKNPAKLEEHFSTMLGQLRRQNEPSQNANLIEENKKFSLKIHAEYYSTNGRIDVTNTAIEFIMNGQGINNFESISYEESGFQERVKNSLSKKNFKKKEKINVFN